MHPTTTLKLDWTIPAHPDDYWSFSAKLSCGWASVYMSELLDSDEFREKGIETSEALAAAMTKSLIANIDDADHIYGVEGPENTYSMTMNIPAEVRERAIAAIRRFAPQITQAASASETLPSEIAKITWRRNSRVSLRTLFFGVPSGRVSAKKSHRGAG